MNQQLSLNLNLQTLYQRLDDAGKKVLLDVLTQGVSQAFIRDMLIAQWSVPKQTEESTEGEKG